MQRLYVQTLVLDHPLFQCSVSAGCCTSGSQSPALPCPALPCSVLSCPALSTEIRPLGVARRVSTSWLFTHMHVQGMSTICHQTARRKTCLLQALKLARSFPGLLEGLLRSEDQDRALTALGACCQQLPLLQVNSTPGSG